MANHTKPPLYSITEAGLDFLFASGALLLQHNSPEHAWVSVLSGVGAGATVWLSLGQGSRSSTGWVLEHQERSMVVANRWGKKRYDQWWRRQIQDLWSPFVHQVARDPVGEGEVYAIAPVNDQRKVRNAQKPWSCHFPTESTSFTCPGSTGRSSSKGELWVYSCPINHPQLFQVLCAHHYLLYSFPPVAFSHAPLTDVYFSLHLQRCNFTHRWGSRGNLIQILKDQKS